MANAKYEALFKENNHEVGVVNSSWAKEYVNGARLTVSDLDNYLLVEFDGYDDDGVKKCKPLTSDATKGFLVSTVEEEALFADETMIQGNYTDFYNKDGDMVKLTIQEPFLRFETSAFTKHTGAETLKLGMVAHYDYATKKYIISKVGSEHSGYSASANKYEVVGISTDFGANVGKETVRLQCMA